MFLLASKSAINYSGKLEHFNATQKNLLAKQIHDRMISTEDWIGNPQGYALKLVKEFLKDGEGDKKMWSDIPYYEIDLQKTSAANKSGLPPIEKFIRDNEPACYRYKREKSQSANSKQMRQNEKNEQVEYDGFGLHDLLKHVVEKNQKISHSIRGCDREYLNND